MRQPIMPSGLKTQLIYAFRLADVDYIIELNRTWNKYCKEYYAQAKTK